MPLPEKQITRGAVEAAATVLGIEENVDTVTAATVTATYRQALRDAHPDSADGSVANLVASDRIFAARTAKKLLLDWIALRPQMNCTICRGSGFVRGSTAFNPRPCPRCT